MIDNVIALLAAFGYPVPISHDDNVILAFSLQKVEAFVKNDINHAEIPEGLREIVTWRVLGEFLLAKKTFAPDALTMLDLSNEAVKQIKAGDTDFVMGTADGAASDEERLDSFINRLLTYGAEQFSVFRRIRW